MGIYAWTNEVICQLTEEFPWQSPWDEGYGVDKTAEFDAFVGEVKRRARREVARLRRRKDLRAIEIETRVDYVRQRTRELGEDISSARWMYEAVCEGNARVHPAGKPRPARFLPLVWGWAGLPSAQDEPVWVMVPMSERRRVH